MTVEYPWEDATAAWVGWVPTVSGHLSFSLIGNGTSARHRLVINGDKPGLDGRVVIVRQMRCNSDFGYSPWIAKKALKDTVQDYVLVAHTETGARPEPVPTATAVNAITDARGCLRGTVFWFPYRRDEDLRAQLGSALSDLVAKQREIDCLHGVKAEAALDQVEQWLRDRLGPVAADVAVQDQDANAVTYQQLAYQFEFALFRTGEFRLWYKRAENDLNELDKIASQVFYFVKDVAHSHSHHHAESDQIVHLARIRPGRYATPAQCETAWRNETQWGLSRVFEQLHRASGIGAQRRALGVLAYADAFQGSVARIMRVPGQYNVFECDPGVALYDNQHRRQSALAIIDYRTFRVGEKGQILLLVVTTLLASAGLWYGFTSIRDILCKQSDANCMILQAPTAARMVALIVNSPMTFCALCGYSIYIAFTITIKDLDDIPVIRRPQSGFLRLSFAVLSGLAAEKRNSRRSLMIYVSLLILGLLIISIAAILLILINQTEIRSFASRVTIDSILQGLP